MLVRAVESSACEISAGDSKFLLRVEVPAPPPNHNWVLPAALPAAMASGSALEIEPFISPRLLQAVPEIQDILAAWTSGNLKRVEVRARSDAGSVDRAEGVGLFFSGGADSLYSLLKNRESVSHLILVQGFDVRLAQNELFSLAQASAQKIAAEFGKQLIVVRSNVRDFSDQYVDWGMYYGAALAMVGHALSSLVGKCIIGSGRSYADLRPWGSHPLLDPLWSSESVSFSHDGLEASRLQKLALIATNDAALRILRVCWESDREYNCGRCEKCLRTMTELLALGRLAECPTLPHEVDSSLIRSIELIETTALYWRELENETGLAPEIRRAISYIVSNYRLGLTPMTGVPSGLKRIKSYLRNVTRLTKAVLPGA